MKKITYIIFIAFWMLCLAGIGIFYLWAPIEKRQYSQEENRLLADMPEATYDNIFSGKFGEGLEQFLLDHFPKRDLVIQQTNNIKNIMSIATYDEYLAVQEEVEDPLDDKNYADNVDDLLDDLLADKGNSTEPTTENRTETSTEPSTENNEESSSKPSTEHDEEFTTVPQQPAVDEDLELPAIEEKPEAEVQDFSKYLGIYMEVDGEKTQLHSYTRDNVLAVTSVLNKYARLLPDGGKLMFTVVPQSSRGNKFVNSSKNGSFYSTYDEVVDAFGDDNVYAFDAAEILCPAIKNGDYVYFRTDMHWTPLGSYLVYKEMALRAGKEPCDYDADFEHTIEKPFLGTYYRDNPTSYMKENADDLDLLMPKFSFEWRRIVAGDEYKLIEFLDFNARANDRYTVYLGGPAGPWTYTESDNGEKENCLVLTDSFGLGFMPFVVTDYKQVHYYDPRYFKEDKVGGNLTQLIEKYNIRDIFVVIGDLHSFSSDFILEDALSQLGNVPQ